MKEKKIIHFTVLKLITQCILILFLLNGVTAWGQATDPSATYFDLTKTTDNLVTLMAASADHNAEIQVVNYGQPKHFWVDNFAQRSNDYLTWKIELPQGGQYHVWALLESGGVLPLKLTNGANTLSFNTKKIGWDKLDCGIISLASGVSSLTLTEGDPNNAGWCRIKSLELVRESDLLAYNGRITQFKQDNKWFAQSGFGLMFQYGAWGYPQSGSRKSIDQGAADFDVTSFVSMVKSTGASYVIWSLTWHQFWMQCPNTAFDSIIGNSALTSQRDLVGAIATALKAEGIRFMLYYHQGIQEEPEWAAKQNWPSEFSATGKGDRSVFFDNWCAVVSEVGKRLGNNLDGWFFDDGCVYYPAPFERLGVAARTGNNQRLISYNPWISSRITDFQDVEMGENSHGESVYGSTPVGGGGVFTDGPYKGLLQQGMFIMEEDWGVNLPNQAINTKVAYSDAYGWMDSAIKRNVPLSFCMMMWENGTVSQNSLNIIKSIGVNFSTLNTGIINNTHLSLSYSGTWSYSGSRGHGDYNDDVHYTSTNGDYCECTFTGNSIELYSEKNSDQGDVDVYIDNVYHSTVSCYSGSRLASQAVFSATVATGTHTLKAVKRSGQYMLIDGYMVLNHVATSLISNSSSSDVFTLFPNPTSGKTTMIVTDITSIGNIDVIDITGKVLLNEQILSTKTTIDMSGYSNGIYFVKLATNKGVVTRKVVKR